MAPGAPAKTRIGDSVAPAHATRADALKQSARPFSGDLGVSKHAQRVIAGAVRTTRTGDPDAIAREQRMDASNKASIGSKEGED